MAGGDEINVMTPLFLKAEHDSCQLPRAYLDTLIMMADFIVLTENTTQVTGAKKYSSGTTGTDKGALLTKMRGVTTDFGELSCPAYAGFVLQTINPAAVWTKSAALENFSRFFSTRLKLA